MAEQTRPTSTESVSEIGLGVAPLPGGGSASPGPRPSVDVPGTPASSSPGWAGVLARVAGLEDLEHPSELDPDEARLVHLAADRPADFAHLPAGDVAALRTTIYSWARDNAPDENARHQQLANVSFLAETDSAEWTAYEAAHRALGERWWNSRNPQERAADLAGVMDRVAEQERAERSPHELAEGGFWWELPSVATARHAGPEAGPHPRGDDPADRESRGSKAAESALLPTAEQEGRPEDRHVEEPPASASERSGEDRSTVDKSPVPAEYRQRGVHGRSGAAGAVGGAAAGLGAGLAGAAQLGAQLHQGDPVEAVVKDVAGLVALGANTVKNAVGKAVDRARSRRGLGARPGYVEPPVVDRAQQATRQV